MHNSRKSGHENQIGDNETQPQSYAVATRDISPDVDNTTKQNMFNALKKLRKALKDPSTTHVVLNAITDNILTLGAFTALGPWNVIANNFFLPAGTPEEERERLNAIAQVGLIAAPLAGKLVSYITDTIEDKLLERRDFNTTLEKLVYSFDQMILESTNAENKRFLTGVKNEIIDIKEELESARGYNVNRTNTGAALQTLSEESTNLTHTHANFE